jgi:hypothetical protein
MSTPRKKPSIARVARSLVRKKKTLRLVDQKLEEDSALKTDGSLYAELEAYLEEAPLLPKRIDAESRATVRRAQRNLQELDALLSRVVFLQITVAKALKTLTRIEVIVRSELIKADFIRDSMTKHAIASRIAVAFPTLVSFQTEWTALEKLAALVHSRLSDSKDSLRLQMKLDDNARWASRNN